MGAVAGIAIILTIYVMTAKPWPVRRRADAQLGVIGSLSRPKVASARLP